MPLGFDEFAESLARHVDVAKHFAAGANPSVESARQQRDLCVSEGRELVRGARRKSFACIEQHDWYVAARQACVRIEFDLRQRKVRGEERMSLRVRVFFADIEQRDFAAREQRFTYVFRCADGI
ncbi:hypothetical protein QFZ97_004286 [Paraburkholderia youngii]